MNQRIQIGAQTEQEAFQNNIETTADAVNNWSTWMRLAGEASTGFGEARQTVQSTETERPKSGK
jgi:hypothetical protein